MTARERHNAAARRYYRKMRMSPEFVKKRRERSRLNYKSSVSSEEKIIEARKKLNERRARNIDLERKRAKEYRIKNRNKILARKRAWHSRKMQTDKGYAILSRLRSRAYFALLGKTKASTTKDLLGCSLDEFKGYLESKFSDGMSWDNFGEWHIDHIRPCASFDLSIPDNQKACFHYTNTQPLWAIDNLKKWAKTIDE